VISCFPWSVLMPEAMRHAAAEPDARAAHLLIALLACALVPVVLHPGVPLSAALPALPAAAILCGRFMDHVIEDPERLQAEVARAARTLALLGSGAALLLAFAAARVPEAASNVRLLAAVTFLTSWFPMLAVWRSQHRFATALIALPLALGAPLASAFVLPDLEGYLSTRTIATVMNQLSPADAPLAVFAAPAPSLNLYMRRNIVRIEPEAAALHALRAEDGLAYAAFSPGMERDVARRIGDSLEVMQRTPTLWLVRVRPTAPRDSLPSPSKRLPHR
jgi:hypothetical protein